jgi:hypothetical protein
MARPTVDQIYNLLRFNANGVFNVVFNRRTNRPDGTAQQGDARSMLFYGGGVGAAPMAQFKQGIIPDMARDAEDFRCAVLTVGSLDVCNRLIAQGVPVIDACWRSWRRIDLVTIQSLSALPTANLPAQLPPDIRANFHAITNAYRLANMPRAAI